jgi:3-phenylpropionate/cinnamic acid dioxygenase small subunit
VTPGALLDREEIHDLVVRYAHAVDRRDWEEVAAVFAPHATADYGYFSGPIAQVLERIRAGLEGFDATMHFVANHLADVRGDDATAETYALCVHRASAAGSVREVTVALRYLDRLERTPTGWRIARREVAVDFDERRERAGGGA